MNLERILLILRARWIAAAITLVVTVVATVAVSLMLPKQYTSNAAVVVDIRSPDPIAGAVLPAFGYLATQVDIIKSDRVAQKVVRNLRLAENPQARQMWMDATDGQGRMEVWFAELLKRKLDIKPSRESNVLNISYTGVDPGFAAGVANAFAQAYIETNIELRVEPARQFARWFEEQSKTLRESLEKAQTRQSDYQQKHGIVASDERLDVESAKLNELSSQLTVLQAQSAEARTKERTGATTDTLPEIMQNSLVLGLKSEIARGEAKLEEMAGNLGRNHPQYRRTEAEVEALRQRLAAETRHITKGLSTTTSVSRDREQELRAAIDRQRAKLLDLKRVRDELAVLHRDVEAAQRAYDGVSQRLNQATLESQATQSNVSMLTPAVEALEPSFPRPVRNTLLSLIGGILLGVVIAYLLEMRDRRIRSVEDLAEMLPVPVLGVISAARPRRLRLLGAR